MAITANQVTLARIVLLPVPVALLIYGNEVCWWVAFFLMVFLGATDFIDGLMARREGPTRLGSLIDPVADKIFVAAICMSLSALGIFPQWVVSLLLVREFLLTAFRSSVAIRQEVLKTSVLGKIKTIVQMGGLGTIFFTVMLPNFVVGVICAILSLGFLLTALIHFIMKKKQTYWALPVFVAFLVVSLLGFFASKNVTILMQVLLIVSITWISAFGYLVGTYRIFRRTGIMEGDFIRLLWSLTHGLLVAPLVYHFPMIVLPLLIIIASEFLLGGIDNISVSEKMFFSDRPFIISNIYGLTLALLLKIGPYYGLYIDPLYLSIIIMFISVVVCAMFFAKNIALFKRESKST